MAPRIFVPRESRPGETRVAATPETVRKLVKRGVEVTIEARAGEMAHFPDADYAGSGAEVSPDRAAGWRAADAVFTVAPPGDEEAGEMARDAVLIGFLEPFASSERVRRLAATGVSTLAMELVPRITRAQSMDALSSQASIAGYKAAVLAASRLGRYFPLLMTAAGTLPPAKVVVIGAGVAGLQALATAKRLGAVVEVSDIRPVVQEQVESLGGRFIDLPEAPSGEGEGGYAKEMGEEFLRKQREILKQHVAAADVVITTAQVPGKPAPRLVGADMVEAMRPGGVIVDVAAAGGGNCELCRPDEEVVHHGVLILGPTNLPASVPRDASTVYARNVLELFSLLLDDEGAMRVDLEDEVVAGTLLTHGGEVVHEAVAASLEEVTR